MVHIILGATLRGRSDRLRRLALRADEQDASATGCDIAQSDERLVQQRNSLREVDDMNVVAGAVR